MRVQLEPEASDELAEATAYPSNQSPRAAESFLADVANAKVLLPQFPRIGTPLHANFRRLLLRTFPYQLVYRIEGDHIVVYALAHQRRRPGYWKKRLAP